MNQGSHDCPITGCARKAGRGKLLCYTHWYQVPDHLRKALYRAWDRGRGAGTLAHHKAIWAAIDSVNNRDSSQQEGTG